MQAASLPATAGWQWVRAGFALFRQQPLSVFTWALALSLMVMIASQLGPIGPLLFVTLMPAVTLMTLSACRHIDAGRIIVPSMWIQPLKTPGIFRKMLALGLLYSVLSMVAGLLAFLPFSGELSQAMQTAGANNDMLPFLEAMRGPLVIFGVLYIIIAALFWHAPALIAWHRLRLVQALFFSGVACWRNKGAFFIYGATWAAIFVGIDICSGILATLGLSPQLVSTIQIPFNIAAGGVLYCSFYPVYSSVFADKDGHKFLDDGQDNQTKTEV